MISTDAEYPQYPAQDHSDREQNAPPWQRREAGTLPIQLTQQDHRLACRNDREQHSDQKQVIRHLDQAGMPRSQAGQLFSRRSSHVGTGPSFGRLSTSSVAGR
jgi:hypothetical protein